MFGTGSRNIAILNWCACAVWITLHVKIIIQPHHIPIHIRIIYYKTEHFISLISFVIFVACVCLEDTVCLQSTILDFKKKHVYVRASVRVCVWKRVNKDVELCKRRIFSFISSVYNGSFSLHAGILCVCLCLFCLSFHTKINKTIFLKYIFNYRGS
jgi:hypothetical protein